MPPLKLLSDPASVRTQVSRRRVRVRVCACRRVCVCVCVFSLKPRCTLKAALLCSLFPKETPIDSNVSPPPASTATPGFLFLFFTPPHSTPPPPSPPSSLHWAPFALWCAGALRRSQANQLLWEFVEQIHKVTLVAHENGQDKDDAP